MEGIKNWLIYVGIHGVGLAIGFVLGAILLTLQANVNKIHWLMRLLLLPVVMIIALIAVAAVTNSLIALLAMFWISSDIGTNIWFYSNVIVPGVTSYVLLWSVYFISPFYKIYFTGFIGLSWISFYLYILYSTISFGIIAEGGYLNELFDVETGFYGTMALIISSIVGAYLAIKHSLDGELGI